MRTFDSRSLAAALILVTAVIAVTLHAQPADEPLESPQAVLSQVVGIRPITITYWSPGVKDREIWGALVPFGQNWRAGANGKTTIQFEEPVLIGEKRLEAGIYGLYILPKSVSEWTLILNSDPVGSPNEFDPELDVLRYEAKTEEVPFRERLQYAIENFSDWPPYTADITLHWERRKVSLPLELVRGSAE